MGLQMEESTVRTTQWGPKRAYKKKFSPVYLLFIY